MRTIPRMILDRNDLELVCSFFLIADRSTDKLVRSHYVLAILYELWPRLNPPSKIFFYANPALVNKSFRLSLVLSAAKSPTETIPRWCPFITMVSITPPEPWFRFLWALWRFHELRSSWNFSVARNVTKLDHSHWVWNISHATSHLWPERSTAVKKPH